MFRTMIVISVDLCGAIFCFIIVFVIRRMWYNFEVSYILSITGFYYSALTFSMFYDLIGYSQHFPLICCSTNMQGRYKVDNQLKYRILKRSKQYTMLSLLGLYQILSRCCSCCTRTRSMVSGGKRAKYNHSTFQQTHYQSHVFQLFSKLKSKIPF